MESLRKVSKFLDIHNLLKLNQEDTENLNRAITSSENKLITKGYPVKKSPGPGSLTPEFCFKEEFSTSSSQTTPKKLKGNPTLVIL